MNPPRPPERLEGERPETFGVASREHWKATGEAVCGDSEHRHNGSCALYESRRTRAAALAACPSPAEDPEGEREAPTHFEWPEAYELGEQQATACGIPLDGRSHTSYRKEVTCVTCLQTMLAAAALVEPATGGFSYGEIDAEMADRLRRTRRAPASGGQATHDAEREADGLRSLLDHAEMQLRDQRERRVTAERETERLREALAKLADERNERRHGRD